ncbi:hypothetical protein CONLIGDRAFT_94036 [Coniochaeta ligniaria NRRL 30616]|uniref:Coiled-coil domain-containing protein 16 n=1 Tax=Coniochaeta ligniaria NRRL 30616 TaxID=1408157 RepID=A0A1J7IDG3_9PEZI|nr:hypothetical protein CONLIGDRAFT_94036 [Coniochaeta ligniaria NRRL 30616]
MADVRALLRQQRAARRIVHPHAAYSEAGKLLCTVCHEQVKAESLWDSHTRSPAHLQRAQKAQASGPSTDQHSASNKRKHDDEEMNDVSLADEAVDGLRKKRSRLDVHGVEAEHDTEMDDKVRTDDGATDKTTPTRVKPPTPPFPRRTSGTPSQGVEIQIPSRPATPVAVRTDFMSANGSNAATSRSPLRPQRELSTVAGFVPATDRTAFISTSSVETATVPPSGTDASSSGAQRNQAAQVIDEDEWAAFEADLLHSNTNGTSVRAGIAAPEDAVIFAPAMTADELAAKSAEEERERRRATADVELDNEKEDATRALEEEFEDMEELEARVRRLKERREALRHHSGTPPVTVAVGSEEEKRAGAAVITGKENGEDAEESDNEEDDDDDEDADDWAGFRFKG